MTKTMDKKNLITKVILSFLMIFVLSYGISNIAGIEVMDSADAALKSQIKANNQTTLTTTIDKAGQNIVKTARDVAIALLVVLVIWMAYSVLIKKSAEGLADMKVRLGGVIIAIALIFFTEQILGTLFGLLGVKL